MYHKKLGWTILICLILLAHFVGAQDIPPSPPAKLSGCLYLKGQLLRGVTGYTIKAYTRSIEILGRIDSEGRYILLIPENVGVKPGDMVEVSLFYQSKRISSPIWLEVPKFGEMKVVGVEY